MSSGEITITCRVIRKFSTYSQFFFIDVTYPGLSTDAVFPVIVKSELLPPGMCPKIKSGDVLCITGGYESHVSEFYSNNCFEAHRIDVVEAWDSKRYGNFFVTGPREKGERAHNLNILIETKRLIAAVQCQNDVLERVFEYLTLKVSTPEIKVIKSGSAIAASQDRLILIWSSGESSISGSAVCDQVKSDPVLSYAVSRVYNLDHPSQVCGVTLDDAITKLIAYQTAQSATDANIRIHAYPRFVPVEELAESVMSALPGHLFNPKSYTDVLSLINADCLFYGSIATREEDAGACGNHIYQNVNSECLEVSKAAAKILEAMTRFDLIRDCNLAGKTAMDVGASPGGWSYYLRLVRGCSRVIAVDGGVLAEPIPAGVEHWKCKGEKAIADLIADEGTHGNVSCFTCDMNTDLFDTVNVFLSAMPLMSPNGLAVLTFKRTIRNTAKWVSTKAEGISILKNHPRIESVKEVHLIANTPNETTVLVSLK